MPAFYHRPATIDALVAESVERVLTLLGIDAAYSNDADDNALAQVATAQGRVLLTRDRGLLKRKLVVYGHCVRSGEPRSQLIAVLHRYRLHDSVRLWSRCLRCNGVLEPVEVDNVVLGMGERYLSEMVDVVRRLNGDTT